MSYNNVYLPDSFTKTPPPLPKTPVPVKATLRPPPVPPRTKPRSHSDSPPVSNETAKLLSKNLSCPLGFDLNKDSYQTKKEQHENEIDFDIEEYFNLIEFVHQRKRKVRNNFDSEQLFTELDLVYVITDELLKKLKKGLVNKFFII